MLTRLLIALLLAASCHTSFAAPPDKFATKDELAQSQERVQKLENELAVQRHILQLSTEANDKRLADFGALATMQGTHTTWVGNIVAMAAVLITVIIALASLAAYFSAVRLAKSQVKDWFSDKEEELQQTIATLKQEVADARTGIAQHVDQVEVDARAAQEKIVAAERLMQPTNGGVAPAKTDESAARQIVSQASADLSSKPESTFSAADYYIRGADLFTNGKFESALDAFNGALKNASESTPGELAKYLFSKAITLGLLKQHSDELAIYDEMEERFGNDPAPAVRDQLARAFVNKGYRLSKSGKLDEANAVNKRVDTLFGQAPEPGLRLLVAKALGNNAFVLHKLSQSARGISLCDEIERRYAADIDQDMRAMVAAAFTQKGYLLAECNDFLGAIAAYDEVERRYGSDAHPAVHTEVIKAKNNKAIALAHLGRTEEEAAIYDLLIPYLRESKSPAMQAQLASSLNGLGYSQIMSAKEHWHSALRAQLLDNAISAFEEARHIASETNDATILGNLGYAFHLTGMNPEAEKYTKACLELGREQSLKAQRTDAQQHRIEPEDSAYEQTLTRIWGELAIKIPATYQV